MKCQKCEGCGLVANDDEQSPWTYWERLPLGSNVAVMMGLVRPIQCPECGGSGEKAEPVK